MVQMDKDPLQELINRLLADNNTGDISAQDIREICIDITDSVEFRSTTILPPSVRSFSIQNQPERVDAGTQISGTLTFLYNINEPQNVDGNLTLLQDAATLVSNIDPAQNSVNVAVNTITLANGGDKTEFTLQGTAIVGAGGAVFDDTFEIIALRDREYLYISAEDDSDPSDVVIASATRVEFVSGTQVLTVPAFTGDKFLTILQRASEPNITQIIIDSVNQFDAFVKTDDALTIDTQLFDAYVSENALVGSVVSGDTITLVRG